MIVKERRTVWYFRSWESMSTYSTILLTQLVTELTIASAGKSSTAQSGHDVLSLLYNQVIFQTIPSTIVTFPVASDAPTSPGCDTPDTSTLAAPQPRGLCECAPYMTCRWDVLSMLYMVSFPDPQYGTKGLGMRPCTCTTQIGHFTYSMVLRVLLRVWE